ncbi:UDP-N-acetylglucosamine 2-epimerase (non-hydrolyzing) [Methanosarcinales archaeon]|nr:MAG: UDP-N-acetylglucosamine 2-epimerase (non-hydrolyzing) [Methanosarcinales archaeon]
MKIISIVGARPQFIKCAPVSTELRKKHEEILIHTGQHYDNELSAVFFEELEIPKPDYNLGVGSGLHGGQTGKILIAVEKVLLKEAPDMVIVYGDTNSTLAGALAAAKLHIKLAHVEAGLRSFDRRMPEEINRVLTDHASDILFCPTQTAVENLKKEGVVGIYNVGDVMFDALLHNKEIAENKSTILEDSGLGHKQYLVATIHRPSNTDDKRNLQNIVDAFCEVDETIIFPVHPRTAKYLEEYGLYEKLKKHAKLIKPLGYLDFLKLMAHARKILTDSGGVQKEAYMLKVPCITLRTNTEWIETVEDGWNVLVGVNKERIIRMVNEFVPDIMQRNVFGDGKASGRVVKIVGE